MSDGMTQYEVLAVCGEPTFKKVFPGTQTIIKNGTEGSETTSEIVVNQASSSEEWTYDFGSYQLIKILN